MPRKAATCDELGNIRVLNVFLMILFKYNMSWTHTFGYEEDPTRRLKG